jgi:hypothetical protein
MMDIPSARLSRRSRGTRDLFKNVWKQAAGSDLQSGYSFVYVWLANQFGHFMIGFAGAILASWVVLFFWPAALSAQQFWPRLGVAVLIGGGWLLIWAAKELLIDLVGGMRLLKLASAQRKAARDGATMPSSKLPRFYQIRGQDLGYIVEALRTYWSTKRRPPIGVDDANKEEDWFIYDIVRDSLADGWFYLTGVLTAVAMFAAPSLAPNAGWPWLVPLATFIVMLVVLFLVSRDWLAEKVAFDQAGLPFVGRFALNSRPSQADRRDVIVNFAYGTRPGTKHLVIIGPPKSGRTTTAVALGVEALLRSGNNTVLYTTWCKLLDRFAEKTLLLHQEQQLQGTETRPTFPPEEVELLIIDDVGAQGEQLLPFVTAGAFGGELRRNEELRSRLGDKRVVWVVGDDPERRVDWIDALEKVFGVGTVEAVEPGETIAFAQRVQPRRAA